MHKDPTFKGRSLALSSDLSIAAPLKRGLVPALDAVSYKTRAQRLLDALHLGRQRSHEHAYARLFSDAVERVGVIQSVRVALLEPEDKLLLTVSFDGNWDAYIRTLWVKVGGLLDVIFCNTEGYVEARLHSFEAWAEWVRHAQVQTHFFYGSADGSATDLLYLRRQERLRQDRPDTDPEAPPAALPRAEQRAREMLEMTEATIDDRQWPRNELMVSTMLRQGIQSLAGLYRLADWYVPGTPDGDVLHRAAHELLLDFVQAWDRNLFKLALANDKTLLRQRFGRQIDWLFGQRPTPRVGVGGGMQLSPQDRGDVQGGIVQGYDGVTHGALLMFSFASAAAGGHFLAALRPRLHAASAGSIVPPGEHRRTLFVTLAGLRRLGLDDATIATLPEAFVQGMAARAGLLGDRHDNHPERWTPPLRRDSTGADDRIDLGAVHAVVYVRVNGPDGALSVWSLDHTAHPLQGEIDRLATLVTGADLLAVEPLRRLYAEPENRNGVQEHFGFTDGNGQPGVGEFAQTEDYPGNTLPFGEFLLGHPGRGDVQPLPGVPPQPVRQPPQWFRNSSFLVVRKYRQWPDRFDNALTRAASDTGLTADEVAARLMGRDREGRALVRRPVLPGSNTNQFTYLADPDGRHCPLHAHVRRANPRRLSYEMVAGEREPRVLRRSVSFGPRLSEEQDPEAERGLMFMAFNADIAEQFEVVQRWLVGGHATDITSGISCPIVGVPEPGRPRRFEFAHAGQLMRITLDGEGTLLADAKPLVRLEWGAYWLAPSLGAIDQLRALALRDASNHNLPFSAERGRALLAGLDNGATGDAEAWKSALEDAESQQGFDAASLWAALRRDSGGARRCPMGVLVGSREGVDRVLRDTERHSSVRGYAERTAHSMGPIFLGLDDRADGRYQDEAGPVVAAIQALDEAHAFAVAQIAVSRRLTRLRRGAIAQARMSNDPVYELVFDWRELVDEVLARLCEHWFGLEAPDQGAHFERGGFRWDAPAGALPRYPGHFMAPSRHIFQPQPGQTVRERGERDGQALTAAMAGFLAAKAGVSLKDRCTRQLATVGNAIVDHPLAKGDPAFAARTMVGAIMGFVPTMDGALRAVAAEWLRTGELGRLRAQGRGRAWTLAEANANLADAMDRALQLRSVPDLVWRTATAAFEVAPGVVAQPGERLVLGLGSAAQEALEEGRRDPSRAMFGGVRGKPGSPTHACPGYAAARAAMLGALSALVGTTLPLQALPGTVSWRVVGDSGFKSAAQPAPPPPAQTPRTPRTPRTQPAAPLPLVMCWGDSWLDYRERLSQGPRIDLLEVLRHRQPPAYRMEGRGGFASYATWGRISEMATRLDRFTAELRARIDIGDPPKAILLSGGGNDSTGDDLTPLVLPYKEGGPYRDEDATKRHIGELAHHYGTVLRGIEATCRDARCPTMPVLMHGYDHPFPGHVLPIWLWPVFGRDRGFPESDQGREAAATVMKSLIDDLNDAQTGLLSEFKLFAHHLNLRGTIQDHWPTNPRLGWSNELHPTEGGFTLMAAKVDEKLQDLLKLPTPQASSVSSEASPEASPS